MNEYMCPAAGARPAQSGAAPVAARPHRRPVRPAPRGGNKNRSTGIWKNSREYADKVQGTYNITAFFMKRSFLCSILYSVDRSKREMLRRIDWRNPDELQQLQPWLCRAYNDLG